MGKWYWVHAVSDCEFCVDAVKLLNETGFQYVLSLYDRNPAILAGMKEMWNHNTTPIIIEYDAAGRSILIGGYTDLLEYFTDQGFVEKTKQISDEPVQKEVSNG